MFAPTDHLHRALASYLGHRPWAVALWRYSELVPLSSLDLDPGSQPEGSPPRCLDLGCGDGLFGSWLWQGGSVVGVDRDAVALDRARRRGVYTSLHEADITALPFDAGRFEVIVANCVIEHLHDLRRALSEARRVLQPGGRFVFTVPAQGFAESLLGARLLRRLGAGSAALAYGRFANRFLSHLNILSDDAWNALLAEAGFARVRLRPYASAAVAALFDLAAAMEVPSLVGHRLVGRWLVVPKGPLAMQLIERAVGDGWPQAGAGLLVEAR